MRTHMLLTQLTDPTFEQSLALCLTTITHLLAEEPTAEGWYALRVATKITRQIVLDEHGRHDIPPRD